MQGPRQLRKLKKKNILCMRGIWLSKKTRFIFFTERIKELKPRRDIIRKYVEREKKTIADTTAEKMKAIE